MIGKKTWVFSDGDLPPKGDSEPYGHEALMIVNAEKTVAEIEMTILFEDKDPKRNIRLRVEAERVKCFRMDMPLGDEEYSVPFGQFAVILNSSEPIVAVYGRLDRRENMAYYPVQGYSV